MANFLHLIIVYESGAFAQLFILFDVYKQLLKNSEPNLRVGKLWELTGDLTVLSANFGVKDPGLLAGERHRSIMSWNWNGSSVLSKWGKK